MFCAKCGKEVPQGLNVCPSCGERIQNQGGDRNVYGGQSAQQAQQAGAASSYRGQTYVQPPPVYVQPGQWDMYNVPPEYKPISMWGYLGYEILFAIPLIGFILLLVFSLGGTQNVNLKNFARSYFCIFILIIFIVLVFLGLSGFAIFGTVMW